MTRFAVYQNRNLRSSVSFPLLVDVQSEVLQDLETRVVIPLARAASFTDFPLRYVMPSVEVEGKKYLLMTPQLTGLSRVLLGPFRGSLDAHARDISRATDILLRGFPDP
ncbi:MAG: CcdB family protein [Steroidobacteraceae bacterium]